MQGGLKNKINNKEMITVLVYVQERCDYYLWKFYSSIFPLVEELEKNYNTRDHYRVWIRKDATILYLAAQLPLQEN